MKSKLALPKKNLLYFFFFIMIFSTCSLNAQMTRDMAVNFLLNSGSGFVYDANNAAVYSPYVDFGSFGPGYEGLLPAGSFINPFITDGNPPLSVTTDSYFFWIDDNPGANFEHAVRFLLLDANHPAPTISNGGIMELDKGWWPEVNDNIGNTWIFFEDDSARATAFPPSATNPQGLVAGIASDPADLIILPPPPSPLQQVTVSATACGLVINGHSDTRMGNNTRRMEQDLMNHYSVPQNRIIKANNHNPATQTQIDAAITALCALDPPCTKVYIRMASHGSAADGSFILSADPTRKITPQQLCTKFRTIARKNVPICALISSCYSGRLLDASNWNFPEGSTIITDADGAHPSYGSSYEGGVNESNYPHAFSQCLNVTGLQKDTADLNDDMMIDECEAYEWVKKKNPCYTQTSNGVMAYPHGKPPNVPNPNPLKRVVGRNTRSMNVNVFNATGSAKTDFQMVFQGNATGGLIRGWRSNAQDQISTPWPGTSGMQTSTYNDTTGLTTVTWKNTSTPIPNGEYVHFGYSGVNNLRPIGMYWTPTTSPQVHIGDAVATNESSIVPHDSDCATVDIRMINRSPESGGWGYPFLAEVYYRVAYEDIPLENLSLGDPAVASLEKFPLGTFLLDPDGAIEFPLNIDTDLYGATHVVLETHLQWDPNLNTAMNLSILEIPNPIGSNCPVRECPSPGLSTANEYIDFVQINGTANFSGDDGGYGDYRGVVTRTFTGSSLLAVFVPGFSASVKPEHWRVWVDYNQDGDFNEPDELIFDWVEESGADVSTLIDIPFTAQPGLTKLRVSMKGLDGDGFPPPGCGPFAAGETEDYYLLIDCAETLDVDFDIVQESPVELINGGIINASNLIGPNASVIYNAGFEINLSDGFAVEAGADFFGMIEGCDTIIVNNTETIEK